MSEKISVIITVYNTEKYLEKCMQSITEQTLKDIEVICINDGSSDNSLKILKKYADCDKRIKIINQINKGTSIAKNIGIKEAKGEYIGFLDSDDYVSPIFYEKLYKSAKKYDAQIAFGEIIGLDNNQKKEILKIRKEKVYYKSNEKIKAVNLPLCCYVWNKIYKNDFLKNKNILFIPNQNYEDILWSHIVIEESSTIVSVPEAVYYYNKNPNSITNTKNEKNHNDFLKSITETMKYIRKNKIRVNYLNYAIPKRIKISLLGIPILDIRFWENLILVYIAKIPIIKINIDKL